MAGTKNACVTRSRVSASRMSAGTTSRTTIVTPPTAMHCNAQLKPLTWNNGIATIATLSTSKPNVGTPARVCAISERWVSIAPFGKPVVPDVYICRKQSPTSPRAATGAADAAASQGSYSSAAPPTTITFSTVSSSPRTGSSSGSSSAPTNSTRALASLTIHATSAEASRWLTGTVTVPARTPATATSRHAALFLSRTATRSSRRRPSPIRAFAACRMRAAHSLQVQLRSRYRSARSSGRSRSHRSIGSSRRSVVMTEAGINFLSSAGECGGARELTIGIVAHVRSPGLWTPARRRPAPCGSPTTRVRRSSGVRTDPGRQAARVACRPVGVSARRTSCACLLHQHRLADLARGRERQLGPEDDLARHLVVRELPAAVLDELVRGGWRLGGRHHVVAADLTQHRIGNADPCAHLHGRMGQEDVLDLHGVHVEPALDEQLLGPSAEGEIPAVVERSQVTGVKPPVPKCRRGGFGHLVVPAGE